MVSVSPRALGWLRNERHPFTPGTAPADTTPRPGWTTVRLPVESIEHGARRLLSYGGEVEVLAPPVLRQRLLDELAAVQGRYGPAR